MIEPFVEKREKPWGYELVFTPVSSPVTGKILHLDKGKRFSYQYHEEKEEVLFLASGEADIIIDGVKSKMELQKGYHISPGVKHRVQAVSDIDIFEVSTPEKGKTIRLEDDYLRKDEIR